MSKHALGPLYVGAQNDQLYIINKPPAPVDEEAERKAFEACVGSVTEMYHYKDVPKLVRRYPEVSNKGGEYITTWVESGWRFWKARAAIAKAKGAALAESEGGDE